MYCQSLTPQYSVQCNTSIKQGATGFGACLKGRIATEASNEAKTYRDGPDPSMVYLNYTKHRTENWVWRGILAPF